MLFMKELAVPKIQHEDYYTVSEAARILDVSPSTVWRWIKAEKLPAYRVGPRTIRIKKKDLDDIVRPVHVKEEPTKKKWVLGGIVSEEELARRRELVAKILELREQANIAPMTTAELVRESRKKEGLKGYEPDY